MLTRACPPSSRADASRGLTSDTRILAKACVNSLLAYATLRKLTRFRFSRFIEKEGSLEVPSTVWTHISDQSDAQAVTQISPDRAELWHLQNNYK